MSLDTKYRPRSYSDVLGQKVSVKTLKGLVRSGAGWRQSYLFAGPYGSGKTTLGRVLARALLCESPVEGEPCDLCSSCTSMLNGSTTNFVEVDAATNSGKADVKKILEELEFSSFSGNRKLYLFDEAHQLSRDALDALLKPMEENQKGTMDKRLVVIFATTEPEKMRQTVLSRCAPAFIIHHVSSEEIADRLAWVCDQEGFSYDRDALLLIADVSEGHIRDALKAVEGVASSNEGHIGVESVRSYLHVDRNDVVCQILKEDEEKALLLCEDLVSDTPVGVAYERLLSGAMFAVELGLGVGDPPPYWNRALLKESYEKYGMKLLSFAELLSSRPSRGLTSAMFKCDVLKWKMDGKLCEIVGPRVVSNAVKTTESTLTVLDKGMSVSSFSRFVKEKLSEMGVALYDQPTLGSPRTIDKGGEGS